MFSSLVTQEAPNFQATAVMPDGSFKDDFKLSDYKGKTVVLFFYPLDFTFVCPTEIIGFDKSIQEFEKRGVQVIGVSVDSQFSHYAWRNTDRKEGGIGEIQYPLVADLSKKISSDYGVLVNGAIALRGLFLIDKEGIVRHQLVNDLPLGRSINEALRMVDALQTFEEVGEVCPANFNKGDDTMKPTQEGLEEYAEGHL
jgi:peroxiredoxin (alkyl hydroperoxide reductase subunit C)